MRAVVVSEYGGPDVLKVADVSEPHAGPGQVRVNVRAAAVNPADVHIRTGKVDSWFNDAVPRPLRPGMDLAGVVDELGDGVQTELSVGDAVMGMVVPMDPTGGSYAEYVALDPRQITRVPEGLSLIEAATIPMNGLTARLALDLLALPIGAWMAVTGAAGAVGGFAIELAKVDGTHVIADAKTSDAELVRRLGADEVFARGEHYAREIRETHADGVDAIIDAALLGGLVEMAIRTGGQLAMLRSAGESGMPALSGRADIVIHEVVVPKYRYARDKLAALGKLAAAGRISARVADVYPVDMAAEAHRRLEAGGLRGRLVLTF